MSSGQGYLYHQTVVASRSSFFDEVLQPPPPTDPLTPVVLQCFLTEGPPIISLTKTIVEQVPRVFDRTLVTKPPSLLA